MRRSKDDITSSTSQRVERTRPESVENALRIGLLGFFSLLVVLGMQFHVGKATIYSDEYAERRAEYHEAILTNIAPRGGTWKDVSAQTLNVRIGTVYLAEAAHRLTGLSVAKIYVLIDTCALFATFLMLMAFLRLFVAVEFATIGLLYFTCVLPLTYLLHVFHPWDRPQLLLWLIMLYLARTGRSFFLLSVIQVISVVVKFDSILFPLFYFLLKANRKQWKPLQETAILGSLALITYLSLKHFLPVPANEPVRFNIAVTLHQLGVNISGLLSENLTYPPVLALAVPAMLALFRLRRPDRYDVASTLFATVLWTIAFFTTRAAEVRAEMSILILLLPSALKSLKEMVGSERGATPLPGQVKPVLSH